MISVADIGSNSIRLAVYDVSDGNVSMLFDRKYTVGLASYVNDGLLSDDGIEVCTSTLNEIISITKSLKVEKTLLFATASLRNITNTEYACMRLKELTGYDVDVISGEDEAYYDRLAVKELCDEDTMVLDIGGGSTEVILPDGRMYSFPLASLNSYRKYIKGIVGEVDDYRKISESFYQLLEKTERTVCRKVLAIGGSMQAYDRMVRRLKSDDLFAVLENDREKAIDALLKCSPERIHTFFCGLAILRSVMKYYGADSVSVSYRSCREGYLIAYLQKEGILNV